MLEGLDVPHCDVGIAVAADQSDIKLVQSLGRVLRISPGTPKKDYYFLSADATKDQIIEAKFENTLKDTDQEWIIDPPTERRFDSPPKISVDLKTQKDRPQASLVARRAALRTPYRLLAASISMIGSWV